MNIILCSASPPVSQATKSPGQPGRPVSIYIYIYRETERDRYIDR